MIDVERLDRKADLEGRRGIYLRHSSLISGSGKGIEGETPMYLRRKADYSRDLLIPFFVSASESTLAESSKLVWKIMTHIYRQLDSQRRKHEAKR